MGETAVGETAVGEAAVGEAAVGEAAVLKSLNRHVKVLRNDFHLLSKKQ